jgi:hypothetical protein
MSLAGRLCWGVILLCLSLPANAEDPSAVFNDAKAYAQGTVDGTGGIVSAEKASTLPHYTTNSPVPSLVPGSVGLGGASAGKIQGCQGQNDTECAAVNFLARNPDSRLRFNLDPATDPSLQAAKQVSMDPNAVVGTGQDGSESVCATRTVTDPATYTTEVCNEYRTATTATCDVSWSVSVSQAHEISKGQSCFSSAGYGDPNGNYSCPTANYGLPQTSQATTYLDQGFDQLYINGARIGTYTAWQKTHCYITTASAGRGGCSVSATSGSGTARGILTIWKDAGGYVTPGADSCAPASLNRVGYGTTMNLCKTGCSSYKKTWACGGQDQNQCNWVYQCDNTGGSQTCPNGWVDRGASCRDGLYDQLIANGCVLSTSVVNPLVADGSDTIHSFYCPQEIDGCVDLEARTQ